MYHKWDVLRFLNYWNCYICYNFSTFFGLEKLIQNYFEIFFYSPCILRKFGDKICEANPMTEANKWSGNLLAKNGKLMAGNQMSCN